MSKRVMSKRFLYGLLSLLVGVLACEPVIAVGWRELLCVFGLMAFVFGPPIYRFVRRIEKPQKQKDN